MDETPKMFDGASQTAKIMLAATATGIVVAVGVNYGMKAYDKIKAKRAQKKETAETE